MKVLHVIPSLSPARGGPGIVLRELTSALTARGVEVHIATTDDDGPDARIPVTFCVPIAESGGIAYYFPRQSRFYTFSWPLTKWLLRHVAEYDLVHIHALFSYPSTVAAWASRRAHIPYVIRPLGTLAAWGLSSRRPLLKRWSLALNERRMLRDAAVVQATSEQERLEAIAACRECHTVVIPNPVPVPADKQSRPRRAKPATLLFLSRIDPKKGLELLLEAFDRVAAADPDIRLVIAGDGDSAFVAAIHRQAASLRCHDQVRFTGNVVGDLKNHLLADADLFVLPSYAENFGVAVVEAMANGVPVLISPNIGIHNEVTAASAGRTAECEAGAIADRIREMLGDPDELIRMGENGRQLALNRYSPRLVADRLLSEYETIVEAGKSGPSGRERAFAG